MYHEITIPSEKHTKIKKTVLLEKHDSELLRKKFRNHIADTIKSKKDTKVFFTDSKKSFPWSPSYLPRLTEWQNVFLIKGR